MALEAWICPSCNNKHRVDVVACKNCGEYKPPSVRKVQAVSTYNLIQEPANRNVNF